MKKQTGIWIDTEKAILVTLSEGQENVIEMDSAIDSGVHHAREGDKGTFMGTRHLNHERTFDERKNNQIDKFIKEVSLQIKNSDELYIFGPAEMKLRLKQNVESDSVLSSKLRAVETTDSMTMNQVTAKVRDFFKE